MGGVLFHRLIRHRIDAKLGKATRFAGTEQVVGTACAKCRVIGVATHRIHVVPATSTLLSVACVSGDGTFALGERSAARDHHKAQFVAQALKRVEFNIVDADVDLSLSGGTLFTFRAQRFDFLLNVRTNGTNRFPLG